MTGRSSSPTTRTGLSATPRSAVLVPALMVVAAVAALAVTLWWEPVIPDGADGLIVWTLIAAGVVGTAITEWVNHSRDRSAPPWDTETIWLLPAAVLTPPLAFTAALVVSIALTLAKRRHPLSWRVVVGAITVLTTVTLHVTSQLVDHFVGGMLWGIGLLMLIGAGMALAMAFALGTPAGSVLWLDPRWSAIELGCAFSGMLVAAAMVTDPWFGLVALAPILLGGVALRWPELNRHAQLDVKTGLPNASHWRESSAALLASARTRRVPAAIMILDLDGFKAVNDTHGHLVGDEVLVRVAEALREHTRPGDVVGRFGGEEFVITTTGMSGSALLACAERIRSAVAGCEHAAGVDTVGATAPTFRVTCTVGIAASTDSGYDLTTLLEGADRALLAGKDSGRDQVRAAAEA